MLEIFAPFIVGLTGSFHCLGMCGPLIMAWSVRYRMNRPGVGLLSGTLLHHLSFHLGRIATYGLLGALVAGLFHAFEAHRFAMQYRAGFAVASGIILILLGLILFGAMPLPRFITRLLSPHASVFDRNFARLANSNNPGSKAGIGLLAGLLPCGLTWAMLVVAASTLSPAKGFATMAFFGLGTIPALLAAGMSASLLSARTRLLGERAASVFIVIMGLSLALRGLGTIFGSGDQCLHCLTGFAGFK
jgi:hypothetical protein